MKKSSVSVLVFVFMVCSLTVQSQGGRWTWINGSAVHGDPGNIGIKGVSNPANYPSARRGAMQWTDRDHNFWMFGGIDSTGWKSDLWKYEPATNTWTWMHGTQTPGLGSSHGAVGVFYPTYNPAARAYGAATWTDRQGNLWLYGGMGVGGVSGGPLADMWMYDIATDQWAFMQGSLATGIGPSYGSQLVASPTNTPGGRVYCDQTWVRSDGTLWLYAGFPDYLSTQPFHDIWKFNTTTHQWAWMGGVQWANCCSGIHGSLGVESPFNLPAGFGGGTVWQGLNDTVYIYGGTYALIGPGFPDLSEVWRLNPSNLFWTWLTGPGGGSMSAAAGHYGPFCQPDTTAFPAPRYAHRNTQAPGCSELFWMFGGYADKWAINDLWAYDLRTRHWIRVSGSNTSIDSGSYGVMGVPSASNMPGARAEHCLWADRKGALYVAGGFMTNGYNYGDMWRFEPDTACMHMASPDIPYVEGGSYRQICTGDTVVMTLSGTHILSVSPDSSATILDSLHVALFPSSLTTYRVGTDYSCQDTMLLSVRPVSTFTTSLAITLGCLDSVSFHGQVIRSAGIYRDTLTTLRGCDSIITLSVSLPPYNTASHSAFICPGDTIYQRSKAIISSGIYRDTLPGVSGCDSIDVLLVSAASPTYSSASQLICRGSVYTFGAQHLTEAGIYHDTLTNVRGCDSIIVLTLTVDTMAPYPTIRRENDSIYILATQADHLQWQYNNVDMPGETGPYIIITQDGIYSLYASDYNGCGNTVSLPVVNLGIQEDAQTGALSISYDPAAQCIRATSTSSQNDIYTLRLIDVLGREVGSQPLQSGVAVMPVSAYPSGAYILVASTPESILLKKILIK